MKKVEFFPMRKEYKEAVEKVVTKSEIQELVYNLINECIIDEERRKSVYYMEHGNYPVQRDLLSKLMYDLELVKADRLSKLQNAVVIEGVTNV